MGIGVLWINLDSYFVNRVVEARQVRINLFILFPLPTAVHPIAVTRCPLCRLGRHACLAHCYINAESAIKHPSFCPPSIARIHILAPALHARLSVLLPMSALGLIRRPRPEMPLQSNHLIASYRRFTPASAASLREHRLRNWSKLF
jgi:hypothetical protein